MAIPKRIEKLSIRNFRGATVPLEIVFDKSKPMVMIFGENGTGKTSIVDALDFVCNQKYGSIEERSSIKKKTHLPAIGKNKNDIEISFCFNGKSWTANHQGSGPNTIPAGYPSAKILRRSKILELIDAPPSERFKTLSQFLSVPNIEKCETTLRDAIRNQEREYNESVRATTQAREQLGILQKKLSESDIPAEEWAKEVTEIDDEKLKNKIKKAEEIQTLQNNRTSANTTLKNAEKIFELAKEKMNQAEIKLAEFQNKESFTNDDLQKLITTARHYFQDHKSIRHCPVCEKDIETERVLNRLGERLNEMKELSKFIEAVQNAKKEKESAEILLKSRKLDYEKSVTTLVNKIRDESKDDINKDVDFDKLISELTDKRDFKVEEKAKEELEEYNKYRTSIKEQKKAAERKKHQQAAIKTFLDSIKRNEELAKENEAIHNRLKVYEEILRDERKQYVDGILSAVSDEVEKLYQSIHPDEGLGGIRLYLKAGVKGSLEYDGNFQDASGVPPQAYYSDGHLDSLGICMFLALTKYFNDGNTIVVLDDVVTSVDETHKERFLDMLHDEADSFCHMVVTTHYRPWRDLYRIGGGPSNKVQFVDLQLWSKDSGIRHTKSGIIVEELKRLKEGITVENRQEIASKAGIVLEGVLDHVVLRYGLLVPRRPLQRYELGIFFDSLSKYTKYIKTEQLDETGSSTMTEIKPLVEKLEKMAWIRNQIGCHWNLNGSLCSDSQVKEFAEHTITLCEALTCSVCGNLPGRDKSGSYWQCQCGKKQMHPLKIP